MAMSARLALRHRLACHLAGGTHLAFPHHGSGFCIFNDVAIAARLLLAEGAVQRLMVVDLDVRQGDGGEDDASLAAVAGLLPDLLEQHRSDLVLSNAGDDPHRHDGLAHLALSSAGLMARERLVLDACLSRRIAVDPG